MHIQHYHRVLYALIGFASAVSAAPKSSCLPIVDLGHVRDPNTILSNQITYTPILQEIHQALSHDPKTDAYLFQNVRYAQAPTGNLRFRAPSPPLTDRDSVKNGEELRVCPQGLPEWQIKATSAAGKFANPNEPFSIDAWVETIRNATIPDVDFNKGTSEDCLFLDVHVPRNVFEGCKKQKPGSPVLVWVCTFQHHISISEVLTHDPRSTEAAVFLVQREATQIPTWSQAAFYLAPPKPQTKV